MNRKEKLKMMKGLNKIHDGLYTLGEVFDESGNTEGRIVFNEMQIGILCSLTKIRSHFRIPYIPQELQGED